MTVRIGYAIDGIKRVDTRLKAMDLGTRDLMQAMVEAAVVLQDQEKRQFESQGAYGGAAWAPLSAQYEAWKSANYPGSLILHREGTLEASLTEPGAEGAIREITAFGLTFGTSVPYGRFHQDGTGTMVARPPLLLLPATRRKITLLLKAAVMKAAMGAF